MKKLLIIVSILCIGGAVFIKYHKNGKIVKNTVLSYVSAPSHINDEGQTVAARVRVLDSFTRVEAVASSFSRYVQHYALKPAEAEVVNFDGNSYWYQEGHVGVLDIPVPSNGLQQCADALIRIRSEYLWEHGQKDKIGFKFTSGHYCSWSKYAAGYRPTVNGNKVTFSKKATPNTSKDNFYKYLNLIYTYAGTYSLAQELPEVNNLSDVEIGDILVYPGFPGHVMMIADIIENQKGERRFLFFQGNTPAQSVHIIKNSANRGESPWYNLRGLTSLETPIYTFSSFKIVRFK